MANITPEEIGTVFTLEVRKARRPHDLYVITAREASRICFVFLNENERNLGAGRFTNFSWEQQPYTVAQCMTLVQFLVSKSPRPEDNGWIDWIGQNVGGKWSLHVGYDIGYYVWFSFEDVRDMMNFSIVFGA